MFWEWFKNPAVDIAHPEEVLSHAPQASLVTDCKSACDIATKTAGPTCSELRTQLECLLLRERLQEKCKMCWVHSKAMLADCLTKVMDSSELRRHLQEGCYALFDEQKVLENRAGQRQSLAVATPELNQSLTGAQVKKLKVLVFDECKTDRFPCSLVLSNMSSSSPALPTAPRWEGG